MPAEWTCWLADLRTNLITAEIPLDGPRVSKKLNASGTCSGTWNLSSTWKGGDPYGLTRPARTAMYLLRDGRPWWGGILWTSRYDSDTGKIDLGASDWWSYFDHRKILPILPAEPDTAYIAKQSVLYTRQDQNTIARNLVSLAQSHTGGNLGVTFDDGLSGELRDRTYYGYELGELGEALRNLSNVEDGPDILFDVAPDLDAHGRPVRIMRLGTPHLGQQGSPHVFEYGGNLLSYTWPSDGTRMMTRAFAVGSGSEVGQMIAVTENSPIYDDGWPLLEGDNGYNTVSEAGTLQDHADADQYAARLPVITPTLEIRGDGRATQSGPVVGPVIGDFGPGDDGRVIITDQFFSQGLDTTMRIVSIDVDPGQGSTEKVTLTMNPVLDDVA
jgi:hypothetical protein